MLTQKEILSSIKAAVQEVIPGAKVYLFGSRARGDWHEDSDWDILVLTKRKYQKAVKNLFHEKLKTVGFVRYYRIQFILATEEEWEEAPQFYSLHKLANPELILL